jgi:hypothetical protein
MSKIALSYAELHNPLFLSGTNHGQKLQQGAKGIDLQYDRKEKELLVLFNGKLAIIPSSNVASMTLLELPKEPVAEIPRDFSVKPVGKLRAQASTPMDHVFAGPGQGKTGE